MGRVPGRVLLAGGPDLDEDELELWAPEVEEGSDISKSSEEEDEPGPPPSPCFSLFSFVKGT